MLMRNRYKDERADVGKILAYLQTLVKLSFLFLFFPNEHEKFTSPPHCFFLKC
jgi:hypothetical protein